ncbi:MAG: acyltransferase family protein, partial [Eubacteriales bacterium]|nr:acyltransferase family protein [Eubacteriales bacterium]
MQNHCAANSNNRIVWISAANVFATLAVVFLHCNGVFWTFPKGRLWYSSNFIETFFYWGVPVFFMISGATLMDYRRKYSTSHFLKKRFNRTFIPFIIWS